MTKIRIDTEHAREVGRRLIAEGDRMAEIGYELQRAIGGLDTGSWDGHSRARAEPMLDRVRPESARVADELDHLGRKLQQVADVFEREDNTATQNFGKMVWGIFETEGKSDIGNDARKFVDDSLGFDAFRSMPHAISDAARFLAPGFAALATEWLPDRAKFKSTTTIGPKYELWPKRRKVSEGKKKKDLRLAAFKGEIWKDETTGNTRLGGVRLGGKAKAKALKGEVGLGADFEDGESMVGAYAKGTLFTAGASGVIGSTDLGLGAGAEVTAGEAEAFVGFKDGNVGAKIGGTLVSAEGTVGMNVAGWNVGLSGEVGVKFELGIEAGKETKVHLGPVSIGLNIGEALGS